MSVAADCGAAGAGSPRRSRPQGGEAGEAALPCLNKNTSIEIPLRRDLREKFNRLSTSHRKTAFALAMNVAWLCAKYGIERIGFLTLSFSDYVTCAREAGRRFNSLRTNVLAGRYEEFICVLERMKSGRIHFHLLVVVPVDIRTGFNFEEAKNGDYSSANEFLRAEWAFWRSITNYDGKHAQHRYATFGRVELLPVKSNKDGISKYVGKYIAKHIDCREQRDKGVRLVRYSAGAKVCNTRFMFWSPRSRLLRWQYSEFGREHGCRDEDELAAKLGKHWRYRYVGYIMNLEPPAIVVEVRIIDGEREPITMKDIWLEDRHMLAATLAEQTGETQWDVYRALFMPNLFKPTLEFQMPALASVFRPTVPGFQSTRL